MVRVEAPEAASEVSPKQKARERTEAWERYLEEAGVVEVAFGELSRVGLPLSFDERDAWPGRQVALRDKTGRTLAMGEVEEIRGARLLVRAPRIEGSDEGSEVASIVVRDARRNERGRLRTEGGDATSLTARIRRSPRPEEPSEHDPLSLRAGGFRATLVGGPFADPSVYVDLERADRALLIDLGSVHRCTGRMLGRVTDVLVSHAHTDHFNGFAKMIRRLVHSTKTLRVYGPARIAERVGSMVDAFTWERSHFDREPCFEVTEFTEGQLRRWRIRPSSEAPELLEERAASDGLLRADGHLKIRARQLDHGTPSNAYAVEEADSLHVRSEKLRAERYKPGPWLGELKRAWRAGDLEGALELPGGREVPLEVLADDLLRVERGQSVAYATDFRESDENRRRAVDIARGAGVLFCECCYAREHYDRAAKYAHLTTDTCAGIAREAEVDQLVPMHFSARYRGQSERLYRELLERFPRVVMPEVVAVDLQ